jgi:pimeloyl-ACP methyl ester carboxylesterase
MLFPDSRAQRLARKRRFWFHVRASLLVVCVVVVSVAAAGTAFQAIATDRDTRHLGVAGRLVDMTGYKLHLHCTGFNQSDGLTIILESGLGSTTSTWARIQDEVSESARVCSYDRSGIGWSDTSPHPKDGTSIARELHELLQRAGVAGKLLLVGHSTGGLYARIFRAQYPERVAGLVLLDASNENQFSQTPDGEIQYRRLKGAYSLLPIAASVGLIRLSPMCDLPEDFPSAARSDFHAMCSRTSTWKSQQHEVDAIAAAMAQVKSQQPLGDLPLVVVTAGGDPQHIEDWLNLQKELVTLSTNGIHIVRPNATHLGLLLNAEDAHACSTAIRNLLRLIRSKPSVTVNWFVSPK